MNRPYTRLALLLLLIAMPAAEAHTSIGTLTTSYTATSVPAHDVAAIKVAA